MIYKGQEVTVVSGGRVNSRILLPGADEPIKVKTEELSEPGPAPEVNEETGAVGDTSPPIPVAPAAPVPATAPPIPEKSEEQSEEQSEETSEEKSEETSEEKSEETSEETASAPEVPVASEETPEEEDERPTSLPDAEIGYEWAEVQEADMGEELEEVEVSEGDDVATLVELRDGRSFVQIPIVLEQPKAAASPFAFPATSKKQRKRDYKPAPPSNVPDPKALPHKRGVALEGRKISDPVLRPTVAEKPTTPRE